VDVLVSISANATEDPLDARGTPFYQVDPDHPLTYRRRSFMIAPHSIKSRRRARRLTNP